MAAYRVIVPKPVSTRLGGCGLSRAGLIRVLTSLHQLSATADNHRPHRDPDDPDLFVYPVTAADGGLWHIFGFRVNDSQAPGYLFVEGFTHETRPAPP